MKFRSNGSTVVSQSKKVLDGSSRHVASCAERSMRREEIDPVKAAFYLHYNTPNNRALSSKLEEYKADMLSGAWQEDHPAPIVFDESGNLIDGQHRLMSIVATGVTVSMYVYRGAPIATQETIDTGKARRLEHLLQIRGEKNTVALAAVLRGVANYEANGNSLERRSPRGLSNRQAISMLELRGEYLRGLATWSRSYHEVIPSFRSVLTKKMSAMLRHAFLEAAPLDEVDNFFALLASQDGAGNEQPVKVLRARLEKIAAERGRGRGVRVNENPIYAYSIKGWNAYLSGDKLDQLRWSSGGKRPEKFPTVLSFED